MQQAPNAVAPAFGFMAFFALLWVGIIVVGLALTILWILALVDAAQREFPDSSEKIAWVIVIALTHGLGALIYWLVGRPRGVRSG